jgi:membrane protein implicated in regulation of membrane protease activity
MSGLGEAFASWPLWALAAAVLVAVEVFVPGAFFLSFALAALAVAALTATGAVALGPLGSLLLFAALGVALIVPCRRALRRWSGRTPDINKY